MTNPTKLDLSGLEETARTFGGLSIGLSTSLALIAAVKERDGLKTELAKAGIEICEDPRSGEMCGFMVNVTEPFLENPTLRAERDAAIRALGEQGRQTDRAQADADGLRGKLAVAEKALETIATTEPWQRCPSTHCERSQECRSPHECSGTGRGIAKRALAALRSPSPKEPTT